MKRNTLIIIGLLSISLIITSCSSKKHLKTALKFDEAGMYEEAANHYMRSLSSNRNNIDAVQGLKRTGQMVLNDKYSDFSTFYRSNQTREAVYSYLEAEGYRSRAAALGVSLRADNRFHPQYIEVRDKYLYELYRSGVIAIERESFSTADQIFSEILSIETNYKDAREYLLIARYEPVYRDGLTFIENSHFRKAYYAFDLILREAGNYKDALTLRTKAQSAAMMTVSLMPVFVSNSSQRPAASNLYSNAVSEINRMNSPFYKLINDPLLNSIPQIQAINDPMAAILIVRGLGLKLQADNILMAKIIRHTETTGTLRKTDKKGYVKQVVETTTETGRKESVTRYNKVTYAEYTRESIAEIRIEFTLVNIHNGEILMTDYVALDDRDRIHYADFNGNYRDLIPGDWKYANREDDSDVMYNNTRAINELQKLFNAPKELRTGRSLMDNLLNITAQEMAIRLARFNPEE